MLSIKCLVCHIFQCVSNTCKVGELLFECLTAWIRLIRRFTRRLVPKQSCSHMTPLSFGRIRGNHVKAQVVINVIRLFDVLPYELWSVVFLNDTLSSYLDLCVGLFFSYDRIYLLYVLIWPPVVVLPLTVTRRYSPCHPNFNVCIVPFFQYFYIC